MLKYVDSKVVFSEVPDEITLAISISNCPGTCKGCHSPWLREDIGESLTVIALYELLEKNNVPKNKTLHILIDADYTDKRAPWVFQRNYLARNGWTRSILVHSRKWETESKLQKEQSKKKTVSGEL